MESGAESRWGPARKFVFAMLCLDALAAGVVWMLALWRGWSSGDEGATAFAIVGAAFVTLGVLSLARASGWSFDSPLRTGGYSLPQPDRYTFADPAARDDARIVGGFLLAAAVLPLATWL